MNGLFYQREYAEFYADNVNLIHQINLVATLNNKTYEERQEIIDKFILKEKKPNLRFGFHFR